MLACQEIEASSETTRSDDETPFKAAAREIDWRVGDYAQYLQGRLLLIPRFASSRVRKPSFLCASFSSWIPQVELFPVGPQRRNRDYAQPSVSSGRLSFIVSRRRVFITTPPVAAPT
jgi:hypothetical protein